MELSIKTPSDLHREIIRLQVVEQNQAILLKERFKSPASIFATVLTLFPKSSTVDGIRHSSLFHQDFMSLASRFVLPFVLNKTLFRRSNFLVKAVIGILSQKAAVYISEDNVSSFWKKIMGVVNKIPGMHSNQTKAPVSLPIITSHSI